MLESPTVILYDLRISALGSKYCCGFSWTLYIFATLLSRHLQESFCIEKQNGLNWNGKQAFLGDPSFPSEAKLLLPTSHSARCSLPMCTNYLTCCNQQAFLGMPNDNVTAHHI